MKKSRYEHGQLKDEEDRMKEVEMP